MEIIPEGKNFRLVQDEELPQILEMLEQHLPHSLKFHQTIKTYLNDRVWQFYFYVSKNWPEEPVCLHFPGCTLTPNKNIYESFGMFCPLDQLENVRLVENEDILIDWMEPVYVNFIHIDIMKHIEKFYKTMGTVETVYGDIFVCTRHVDEMDVECTLPSDEVEMRPLTIDNVQAIHDLYPASEIESVEIFHILIKKLYGLGIFSVETGELAAWMIQSYYGAMFSMQTRPAFRRKGYGIHLARALTKLVLERGYKPFVVIRPENDASRGLYTKLGFEKAYQTVRAVFTPFSQSIGTTNGSSTTNGKANGSSNGNTNGNSNGKTDSDEN